MVDLQYKIEGSDMQVLNVYLQPGQVVKSEPGLMLLMENGIEMTTATGGMMTGLKRMLGGGGFFISEFIQRQTRNKPCGRCASPDPTAAPPSGVGARRRYNCQLPRDECWL